MSQIEASVSHDFNEWRQEARKLLRAQVPPPEVVWKSSLSEQNELFSFSKTSSLVPKALNEIRVPAEFISKAKLVYACRSDDTPAFLYRILWRSVYEDSNLFKISIDADVQEFESRYHSVCRDMHKMKAFVRFREVEDRFIAWHGPDHRIIRLVAPFFAERFNGMNWSILTEDGCAHWDQTSLTFTEGLPQSEAPQFDAGEALWKIYYQSIFNPARIKLKAMTKELPIRYWRSLPETGVISELLRTAPERLQGFYEASKVPTAEQWLPSLSEGELTHDRLKEALPQCRACGICERATQPVLGEGPLSAEIVFIGEQPGEEEDQSGRPFVGPAGQVLNQAFEQVGLDRKELYLTNAVKAYKWTEKEGVGRIHRGSSPQEISICNPWLKAELSLLKPKVIVGLGRSAAQALLGKSVLMRDVRGQFFKTPFCERTLIVPHPSYILRIQDRDAQQAEFNQWVRELKQIVAA
ncbi:MAG: UdgX family uracil-DNA binding protein [Bdellovibrionales bacterium]|nr:UdgX family uracil-DNA binding protein [Oligoflexia bacterium]